MEEGTYSIRTTRLKSNKTGAEILEDKLLGPKCRCGVRNCPDADSLMHALDIKFDINVPEDKIYIMSKAQYDAYRSLGYGKEE